MPEEKTFVNALVPEELANQLKKIADSKHVSRSDVVRWAMENFVRENRVVSVSNLPHPPDAEPVPLVIVAPAESEESEP